MGLTNVWLPYTLYWLLFYCTLDMDITISTCTLWKVKFVQQHWNKPVPKCITRSILYHVETVNYHSILCKIIQHVVKPFWYNMQVQYKLLHNRSMLYSAVRLMKHIQSDGVCQNKRTWYLMKGFIPSITILSELCVDYYYTITHSFHSVFYCSLRLAPWCLASTLITIYYTQDLYSLVGGMSYVLDCFWETYTNKTTFIRGRYDNMCFYTDNHNIQNILVAGMEFLTTNL